MKLLLLFCLTGCGVDGFLPPIGDGDSETEAGDSQSKVDSQEVDAGNGNDAGNVEDSQADVKPLDAKPPCDGGTGQQACEDVVTAYCSRLANCCANACPYAWANAGGQACHDHYTQQFGGCASRSNSMTCDSQCLSDIATTNCGNIMAQQNTTWKQVSSSVACQSFWQ